MVTTVNLAVVLDVAQEPSSEQEVTGTMVVVADVDDREVLTVEPAGAVVVVALEEELDSVEGGTTNVPDVELYSAVVG